MINHRDELDRIMIEQAVLIDLLADVQAGKFRFPGYEEQMAEQASQDEQGQIWYS